jgi:hypothetical protein
MLSLMEKVRSPRRSKALSDLPRAERYIGEWWR